MLFVKDLSAKLISDHHTHNFILGASLPFFPHSEITCLPFYIKMEK